MCTRVSNCPNCGAPRNGSICEYCGTRFEERISVDEYSPFRINVSIGHVKEEPERIFFRDWAGRVVKEVIVQR